VLVTAVGGTKAENLVALQVHSLYFGILIAHLQKQAAEHQSTYAGEHLRESEQDERNGNALNVAAIQGRARLLESQQSVLTAELLSSAIIASVG
jgi:outer membrane protein TolC